MNTGTQAQPLAVCMISDDFLPGATGVGTHLQAIGEQLAARGHRIAVITTRRPGEPEFEVWRGVRVHRTPTVRVAGFYQALPRRQLIQRILDEEQPDLIHQHYLGWMLMRVSKEARRRGIRQVYTYHMTADVLVQPWFMKPFRPLIEAQIVRSVNQMDLVISVSRGIADMLPANGITRPVVVISNPVSFPDPALALPAERDGGFVVFYAGRLEPEKNLPLLLRGFAEFSQATDAVLWIAGRGSQQAPLAALCDELGITARVRFLGFLDMAALASRYAACDLFVLPSLVETQGLVAMEAMWYGKPVLVADSVVSRHELVVDGRNGEIFDHRSPADLAARLRQWASSPARRESAGLQGAEIARGWSPDGITSALEAAYRRCGAAPRV